MSPFLWATSFLTSEVAQLAKIAQSGHPGHYQKLPEIQSQASNLCRLFIGQQWWNDRFIIPMSRVQVLTLDSIGRESSELELACLVP
jgi:hypothetical protein